MSGLPPFVCALLTAMLSTPAGADPLYAYAITNDAIPKSLTDRPGDPARGRAIVGDRQRGLCLLCHTGPFPDAHEQGTLAPDLGGAGARYTEGQLRLRIVDMKRINPSSIMPAYYKVEDLERVGLSWRGKPVLSAEEIEDVVAYLATLKD